MSAFSQGTYKKRPDVDRGESTSYDNVGFSSNERGLPAVYDVGVTPNPRKGPLSTKDVFSGSGGATFSGGRRNRLCALAAFLVVVVILGVALGLLLTNENEDEETARNGANVQTASTTSTVTLTSSTSSRDTASLQTTVQTSTPSTSGSTSPPTSSSTTATPDDCDENADKQYYVWVPLFNDTDELIGSLYRQIVSTLTESAAGLCSITREGVFTKPNNGGRSWGTKSEWFLVVELRFADGAGTTEGSILALFANIAAIYDIPLFTVVVQTVAPVCEFRCPVTLHCISMTSLCDGVLDCRSSGLDESEALCEQQTTTLTPEITSPGPGCLVDEYECASGECIVQEWRCDEYVDCQDGSDEEGCDCRKDEYRCYNGECVSETKRCDVIECREDEYRCYNGECVSETKRCDGQADCVDHTDEHDCPPIQAECTETEFECIKRPECIATSLRCDGQYDCQDRSDEWYQCGHTSTTTIPFTDLEVRLMQNDVDTTQSLFGRVEVRRRGSNDVFGTVCDDMWSAKDAMVVCRMVDIGFTGPAYAYSFARFGKGAGPIVMTNVDCDGSEANIGQCPSRDTVHCTHAEDAGVQCGGVPLQTTPSPTTERVVRLSRGQTCLDGDVQLYHDGEWRFICDTNFDDRLATVVCRMLGYNAGPGVVGWRERVGDEKFWLDHVTCRGDEADIRDCESGPLGEHSCRYYQISSIYCAGDPERECSRQIEPCVTNVSCDFDDNDCCYGFASGAPYVKGSSTWVWYIAGQIDVTDVTTGLDTGGVVYYKNVFGSVGDYGSLILPPLGHSSMARSLTFHYLVQAYGHDALSFVMQTADGRNTMLWETDRVPVYLEGTWGIACVDIPVDVTSDELRFVARRGSRDGRVVALDDISLTDGRCNNSILASPCHFDKPYQCGMQILCEDCREGVTEYQWKWSSRDFESKSPKAVEALPEYFMIADASRGHRGNVARLQFGLPSNQLMEGLKFLYKLPRDEHAALKVLVKQGTVSYYTWNTIFEEITGEWQYACAHISGISGETSIVFEAMHGDGPFGDIILDHVELMESCPDEPCNVQTGNCPVKFYSTNADEYFWVKSKGEEKIIRLVDGKSPNEGRVEVFLNGDWGTICDDDWTVNEAEVVCRQLGYRSTINHYGHAHFGQGEGYIWLAGLACQGSEQRISDCDFSDIENDACDHTEDVGVECYSPGHTKEAVQGDIYTVKDDGADIGTKAIMVYPDLSLPDGLKKLTFQLKLTTHDIVNIYLIHAEDLQEPLYSLVSTRSSIYESVCINLPETTNTPKRLIFEAVKKRDIHSEEASHEGEFAINAVNITSGQCKDTLSETGCTFEEDFRLCGFNVTSAAQHSCRSGYQWRRQTGVRNDHTYGDPRGHFMYVDKTVGLVPKESTITFQPFEVDSEAPDMHVMLYFLTEDTIDPSAGLWLNINDNSLRLENHVTSSDSWIPVCVPIPSDAYSSVTVSVTAVNTDAAFDDVTVGAGPCPEMSVNCDFNNSFLCGYVAETGWRFMDLDNEIFLRSHALTSKLFSPPFEIGNSERCLTISSRATKSQSPKTSTEMHLELIQLLSGESQQHVTSNIPVYDTDWANISMKVPGVSGKCIAVVSLIKGIDDTAVIDIRDITLSDSSCPARDCQDSYHACDEKFCLPGRYVCDNEQDCADGSDEANCPIKVNCTFDNAFACGYQLKNSHVSWTGGDIDNDGQALGVTERGKRIQRNPGDALLFFEFHVSVLYTGHVKEPEGWDPYVVLQGDSNLAYIETPIVEVEASDCLTFTFSRHGNRNLFRVVQNSTSALAELATFSDLLVQDKQVYVSIVLPPGTYSIILESQSIGGQSTEGDIHVDNVSVQEGACCDTCARDLFTCNYTGRDNHPYTVCLTADVICNGKQECPSGADEEICPNTFDCDFESLAEPLCNYEIKSPHISVVKTPHHDPEGFTISSDNSGDYVLLYTPTSLEEETSITTGRLIVGGSDCAISVRIFLHKPAECDSAQVLDLTLLDETQQSKTVHPSISNLTTNQWITYTVSRMDFLLPTSAGSYRLRITMLSDCIVVAINSIASENCDGAGGKASTTPTTTLSTPKPILSTLNPDLPDGFPDVQVNPIPPAIPRLDNVQLVCNVTSNSNYKVTYYWYHNGRQLTRGPDVLHQKELDIPVSTDNRLKYEVDVSHVADGTSVVYSLKINRLDYDDEGTYTCMVDVWGYNDTQRPLDVMYFRVTEREPTLEDDNCYSTSVEVCHTLGQRKTILPGAFGVYDFTHANVLMARDPATNPLNAEICEVPLQQLMCGLYTPDCDLGDQVPICREDCEDIVHACTSSDILEYGCRFLPYRNDNSACKRILAGCGLTLSATNNARYIRSENYSLTYPTNEVCRYFLEAEKFHYIEFRLIDFQLDASQPNAACTVEFYDGNDESTAVILPCDSTHINDVITTSINAAILKLVMESASILLSYKAVAAYGCDVIHVESSVVVQSVDYPDNPTDAATCRSHLLYAKHPRDVIVVKINDLIDGCARVFRIHQDIESTPFRTFCSAPYEFNTTGQVLVEFDTTSVYSFISEVQTYTRHIDQVRLDSDGRVELFSDGAVGSLCNWPGDDAAELICRALGEKYFVSYEESKDVVIPPLVNDIKCGGKANSITECAVDFDVDNCPWQGNIITLECTPATISCTFSESTCGYKTSGDLTRSSDGLHLDEIPRASGTAVSANFTYTEGAYLHFNYIIRGNMDTLKIYITDVLEQTSIELWRWNNYQTNGEFTGCVALPPIADKGSEHQLVIELASNLATPDNGQGYTGVKHIAVLNDKCPDNLCTFEDPHACETFVRLCSDETTMTPSTHLSSGIFETGDWVIHDHTVESTHGHYLVIDEQGPRPIPFLNVTNADVQSTFLRLFYSIHTINISEHIAMTLLDGPTVLLQVFGSGPGWHGACIALPDNVADVIYLSFTDETPGGSLVRSASLFLDDISLSSKPCLDTISCTFEDGCTDRFACPGDCQYPWTRLATTSGDNPQSLIPTHDITYHSATTGHVLYANLNSATEGDVAVAELGLNHWFPAHVCLNFYFFIRAHDGDAGSLKVKLLNTHRSHVVFVANGDQGDSWHARSISVPRDVSKIQFIAVKGQGDSFIGIDDISISQDNCVEGLQELDYCSFDYPEFCTANIYTNSDTGYQWARFMTSHGDAATLEYDADGKTDNGYYIAIHGTDGEEGDVATMQFRVQAGSQQAYQFWYRVSNTADHALSTFLSGEDVQYLPVQIVNTWLMSPCLQLPEGFSGFIYINTERGEDLNNIVAVDNVKVLDSVNCEGPTLACDFSEKNRDCGFLSVSKTWSRGPGGWKTTSSGLLIAPAVIIPSGNQCFGFTYSVQKIANDYPVLSVIYNGESVWVTTGERHVSELRYGQITMSQGEAHVSFHSSGDGIYTIVSTTLTSGQCQIIQGCKSDEFGCTDRCLPTSKRCDGYADCDGGQDELLSTCGFNLSTSFTTAQTLAETGYRNVEDSIAEWGLADATPMVIKGITSMLDTQMLATRFKRFTMGRSVLQSPVYHLEDSDSCLQIHYVTNAGYFSVELSHSDGKDSKTIEASTVASSSLRPLLVPVGAGLLQFRLVVGASRANFKFDAAGLLDSLDLTFAVSEIIIHPGIVCSSIQIDCPGDIPLACSDSSGCYTPNQHCDMAESCLDGSDETVGCGYGIECDFELENMCGYTNMTTPRLYIDRRSYYFEQQSLWERTASTVISRPLRDHTYRDIRKGHFMSSRNYEGLMDLHRYVDEEVMVSPAQSFPAPGCVHFWYYLNSTGHQPKANTAQIFVYMKYEDTQEMMLYWYDHVNRLITDWIKGGVPVEADRSVSLVIKAKTSVPHDVYASVVAIDDVSFIEGPCTVVKPVCDQSTFRCSKDDVCVPVGFVCDGEPDCQDGSDEMSCSDKPDGALQLMGGDGTYGKLSYFYRHAWRPVCYPQSQFEQEKFDTREAHELCMRLGFRGNADSIGYRFWEKHTDVFIRFNCDNTTCAAAPVVDNCDLYTYLRCSNSVCFSGEELCPATSSTCKPRSFFCDGEMHCPGNGDENNCYCKPGETTCRHLEHGCEDDCETCESRSQFKCGNHQCVDLSRRCDGTSDCDDGTDEYRCVQIAKTLEVTVFDRGSLSRRQVCVDDIGVQEAQQFCHLAGKGYLLEILRGNDEILSGVAATLLGEGMSADFELLDKRSCFPLRLKCQQPECGTTVVQDSLVQALILNGEDAHIAEWPFYVRLYKNDIFICGATLISPGWVLSALHCFPEEIANYSVVLGTDNTFYEGELKQTIRIKEVIAFDYSAAFGSVPIYDIVLLKLERDALLNDVTRPACLPTQQSHDSAFARGKATACYAVGFGAMEGVLFHPDSRSVHPTTLQKQRVDLIPMATCKASWDPYGGVDDHVVCASREGPNAPTCFGDSGGPLLCKNEGGRWELFGALSFGLGNCDSDTVPAVFTSTLWFKDWIASVTGIEV